MPPTGGTPYVRHRVDAWRRDLLDITVRNNLISMRAGTRILPLLVTDCRSLENEMQAERTFTILPRPDGWNGGEPYAKHPFEPGSYMGGYAGTAADEMSRGYLRSPLPAKETEQAVRNIYRSARKEVEESGFNALFVGIGILRWFEGHSTRPRYAPLILIPAQIVKRNAGYTLTKYDEEAVFNVTLTEFLRQVHGITLSGLDGIPSDESGTDVDHVLRTVRT